ncbi:hypothetical protein DGWBC_1538 [Dehalogenimonas sp. WBC-2]|nr:hypothetical protein DGWBC_1538 [Dehalogenimonas sp. WBC-2]
MNCPKDRSPMIVVEHDQVAIDYCPVCHGVWLDRGELELVVEKTCLDDASLCLTDIFNRPEARTDEKKRRCPICNTTMRKEGLGTSPEVIIDVCSSRYDGLWFDGGELHQVLAQLPTVNNNSDGKMLAFLKEVLKADTAD